MGLALAISIMINLHILPIPLSCHAMHPSSRRLPQSVVQLTNVLTLSSSSYSDEGDDSITLWRGILHEWVSKCMSRKKIANSKKQSRRGSMGSWGWIPSLSYMEEKLETTKIITASNNLDKRITSKIPFEYTHPEWSPLPEKYQPTCADLH